MKMKLREHTVDLAVALILLGLMIAATKIFGSPWVPPMQPINGTKTLTCVVMTYSDGRHATDVQACQDNVKMVSEFYERNSRGDLHLVPLTKVLLAPYSSVDSTEGKDRDFLKAAIKSDFYILPRICSGTSHAGRGVAWMCGLSWDSAHEVGHILSLGHSGIPGDEYGDRGSIMGNHLANWITAPQYYWLGWLPDSEIAIKTDKAAQTYELKRLNNYDLKSLVTVAIDPALIGTGRPLFLSYPATCDVPCVAIHFLNTGGSTRMAIVRDTWSNPAWGLTVTVLPSGSQDKVKFRVEMSN